MLRAFNFSIVATNIELSKPLDINADRAVCGHVGISELSLPIAAHDTRH